jgi:hypothetical protein
MTPRLEFLPLTTASVLALICIGPSYWNPAPAPKKGPLFARIKGSAHHTIHDDNGLLKELYGDDYEWSLANDRHEPMRSPKQ